MAVVKSTAFVAIVGLASKAVAHGLVTGIIAEGVYHQGYGPGFAWTQNPPAVAAWSTPEDKDTGYVNDYTSPDIICHKGATPGQLYVTVAAGDQVTLEWTNWPESHHGPVMDYLANCNGECTDVNKEDLLFNKIDESGLISWDASPGKWASDDLIANNNSWTVTIPASIAPGKYVLRHEIIALHSANNMNGAQNYPQCVNLEITGSGSDSLPSGTKGTDLYTANDPGIFINIYWPKVTSYIIPGPKLVDAATAPASPSDSISTPSTTRAPSGARPTYPPYGNGTITTHITETLTTFETVTVYPTSTVNSDADQDCDSESSSSSSLSSIPANINIPSTPSATPTTLTSMYMPASSTVAAAEGSPTTDITGKPRKFVCYEEID